MAHSNPSNMLNPDAPAFSPSSIPSQQASDQHQYRFQVLQEPYIYEGTSYYTNPPQILLPTPSLQQSSQQPPSQPLPSQPLPSQAHGCHNSSSSSGSNHSNSNGNGYSSNGYSSGYNSPSQIGSTTLHNNLYAHFTTTNRTVPFHDSQTITLSSNGHHYFPFHNHYNYKNNHYSNNSPSYNPYPVNYSNFGPFSTPTKQVGGVNNGFRNQHNTTNGHGGIWQQQPNNDRGKKSKKNKRKKHGKGWGKKNDEANGDELDTDKTNGDGAGGNHANGAEANGGETNGGETNDNGTLDGDTSNGCDGKSEEEET
ncbi:hypothetical protein COCMIDRAFT_31997 [Bipolaris oryzae ATCC 44560]|uniref:Uncharacterized protein n=1 Tax=Bipolaris oryzae ATCC 44560 TaxID=930090 RepID=W6ZG59_COCMI|nr:uncharacterized protein COCMIDRAFT_31997 [Bipolaris oryzae ATCC 44560]EUC50797.1 hypothetical protein COCMIDRAFT_31997 [Bipolaris oryzae ATCC 44560]